MWERFCWYFTLVHWESINVVVGHVSKIDVDRRLLGVYGRRRPFLAVSKEFDVKLYLDIAVPLRLCSRKILRS